MADDLTPPGTTTAPTTPTTPPAAVVAPAVPAVRGLDLKTTLADPRFMSLPPTERHRFLTRNFPDYAQLPREEQRKFFIANALKHTSLAGSVGEEVENLFKGAGRTMLGAMTHAPSISPVMSGETVGEAAPEFGERHPAPDLSALPRGAIDQLTYTPPSVMQERPGLISRTAGMLDFLVGGNPDAVREASARGDTGAEFGHALTVPLLTFGLGEFFKGLTPAREMVAPTRQEVSSLRAMAGTRGITGAGPVDAVERTVAIQNLYKQALMEHGVSDAVLKDMFPTGEKMGSQADVVGRVTRGNDLVLRSSRDAVDIAERPLNAALKLYEDLPTSGLNERIADELRRQAVDLGRVDERMGRALNGLADKVFEAKTVGDLNRIKVHANKLVNDVYSAIPGKAIAASAETAYAYKLAADAIRQDMYPVLEAKSGGKLDLGRMGQREADAIAMRDALHQTYYSQVAPQAASREASGFLGYVFGGEGPSHSLYSRHILARAAEKAHIIPGPGGKFNLQFRRGMERGEGAVPERVRIEPPPAVKEARPVAKQEKGAVVIGPNDVAVQRGASTADLMLDRMRTQKLSPGAVYTDEGFRSAFNIPDRVGFRELEASGLAERTADGKWQIGPRLRHRLQIEVSPFRPGLRPVPGRRLRGHARAQAVMQGSRLTPPPKSGDEPETPPDFEDEEPPE